MDFKIFFIGIGLFLLGFLQYYLVKGEKPASQEANWEGAVLWRYIRLWVIGLLCAIVGLVLIFQSFTK